MTLHKGWKLVSYCMCTFNKYNVNTVNTFEMNNLVDLIQ
jgi:hypothetical protein